MSPELVKLNEQNCILAYELLRVFLFSVWYDSLGCYLACKNCIRMLWYRRRGLPLIAVNPIHYPGRFVVPPLICCIHLEVQYKIY